MRFEPFESFESSNIFETYRYIPKKEIKNAALFSGICLFSAAALIIASAFISSNSQYVQIIRVIYRLSAVVFAAAGFLITTRFILSGYIYILNKTDFIVVRANGAKSEQVCSVSLETAAGVFEKAKKLSETEKQCGKINTKRNFCQNMFPYKSYIYVFELNQKRTALLFEADKSFITELHRRIEYAKSEYAKMSDTSNLSNL